MTQLTAAGGVLYRPADDELLVLLIFRNGVWDLPKGKAEKDESVEECAAREVAEEAGIPEPVIETFLCSTYHEYDMNGKRYGKTTHWYSMREATVSEMQPQREEGITKVEWTSLHEAINKTGYENLKTVLIAFAGVTEDRAGG
ncbi:NUDIX hydrolase [Rhodohalobacter mucosus]|uniref:NUDIX hydrolase n=1 Tax=Rhodohalobacter mucosus TaxID=2079485 RepID=UPI00130503B2|nr:NUDIX domain-containing protein [Rhodohalobacter mucosus]